MASSAAFDGVGDKLLGLGVGTEQGELGFLRLQFSVHGVHRLVDPVEGVRRVLGGLGLLNSGEGCLRSVDLGLRRLRATNGQEGDNEQRYTY